MCARMLMACLSFPSVIPEDAAEDDLYGAEGISVFLHLAPSPALLDVPWRIHLSHFSVSVAILIVEPCLTVTSLRLTDPKIVVCHWSFSVLIFMPFILHFLSALLLMSYLSSSFSRLFHILVLCVYSFVGIYLFTLYVRKSVYTCLCMSETFRLYGMSMNA